MAGDWIKMRADLRTHPKVVRVSSALKADRLRVIGALFVAWSVFDAHSVDGTLEGYSADVLDETVGFPGFSRALIAVGWLEEHGEGDAQTLVAPRFSEHNGQSAKKRGLDAERKRTTRNAPTSVREMSASQADKSRTREEKRREDKEDPHSPPPAGGGGVGGDSAEPTKAGAICKAVRARGIPDANPSHPELLAYIAKGVTIEVFEAAAERCVKAVPPKGMAYLLGIVKRQLSEAAGIAAGVGMPARPWDENRATIEAKGVELGVGRWDEHDLSPDRESFAAYTERVRSALANYEGVAA